MSFLFRLAAGIAACACVTVATAQFIPPQETYTYARCWYAMAEQPQRDPRTNYVWARDDDGNALKVSGYWWSGEWYQWRNMFYTPTTRAVLEEHCRRSLREEGIERPLLDVHAADHALSFNHSFWSESTSTGVDRLVVFGDSLSDTGNLFNGAQWQFPHADTWMLGRFSNGPLWPEYVSRALKLPLYNWAVGGSAAKAYLVVPGLRDQVTSWLDYMDRTRHFQPDQAIYLVWVGANDIINYERPVDEVITSLEQSLHQLLLRGATRVAVLNLPDLSLTPAIANSPRATAVARDVARYNTGLRDVVQRVTQRTGIHVRLIDTHAMLDDLIAYAPEHGFTHTTQSCLAVPTGTALDYAAAPALRSECTDPDTFVFWDNLHPTTRVHALIGERVGRRLREWD